MKILIITGPTATGKTAIGVDLAKKFNGEIISADSRQVYKYMDIGTGKDLENFQWGINLVEPGQEFSVSDWVNYANDKIKDIYSRKKLPIIVGGTGQYIKELLWPSETLHIPPNYELRSMNYELWELQKKLQEINPQRWEMMNKSDRMNSRRLVRAIEVAMTGLNPVMQGSTLLKALIIGLTAPYEFLYKRIDKRVEDRITAGMEQEREKLKKYKLPITLGYNSETAQEWKFVEHAYARRQMTYLKNQIPGIIWFDISVNNWKDRLWPIIKSFLIT